MPELPEVETVMRGLEPVLAGHVLTRVEARRPDLRFPLPDRFAERLEGQRVIALERRAKYILAHLEGGETLILHLGMSGRFSVHTEGASARPGHFALQTAEPGGGAGPHDHVVFETDAPARIVYTDHRRFGIMDLAQKGRLCEHRLLKDLGLEPLGALTPADLEARLEGKRTPIKAALLDQRIIAGLGNIYVCEALHRAGISPRRVAHSVRGKRAAGLVPAIRTVLEEAIAAGGSTLRDYAGADGELGYFQHAFAVYGRAGQPCARPGCTGTIARLVQAGRSTFFCSRCQR